MKTLKKAYITLVIAIVIGLVVFVPGCKEFNDNPVERTGTLRIDVQSLQRQLGISQSNGKSASITNVPGDTEATNPVKGLIVGVMLVTSRSAPYTSDVAMTEAAIGSALTTVVFLFAWFRVKHLVSENRKGGKE